MNSGEAQARTGLDSNTALSESKTNGNNVALKIDKSLPTGAKGE